MAATTDGNTVESELEIVIERFIEAPRELVFRAWTELEHLEKWWGPEGVTAITTERDFSVGGTWRYVMRGPDGSEVGMTSTFLEIVPPERVVTADVHEKREDYEIPADNTATVIF